MSGPRPGSRTWSLARMAPGDVQLYLAPSGRSAALMQQVRSDIGRIGGDAKTFQQALIVGVELATRRVHDIVKVSRLPGGPLKTSPVPKNDHS